MKNIRCCVINKKYRGIDREVDMRMFLKEKDSAKGERALEHYWLYLSTEGVYSLENLQTHFSFADFVNRNYGTCEVILFSVQAIEEEISCCFLGIDIIDEHLCSVIKKGAIAKDNSCFTNQYGLYNTYSDAYSVVQRLKRIHRKYSDLYCVYVYVCNNKPLRCSVF